MNHECRYCGREFQTDDQLQEHRSTGFPGDTLSLDGGGLQPDLPMPDFTDPFAPDPESEQELQCLHCENTFSAADVRYDDRHGQRLWWCPNQRCDGRGVGIDLVPVGEETPTTGLVAPDRTDVPRGYRSKTIPSSALPANWRIESEERNRNEIINRYHHTHLDLRMNIAGVRLSYPGAMEYKITITSPADAEPATGYDTFLETATDITEFDPARDRATELMEQLDQSAHNGATAVIQTALHLVNPDHHQEPAADHLTGSEHACQTCGMETAIYRGDTPNERLHHHIKHLPDETHAEQ